MFAVLSRVRYGSLLAVPVLLLCAAGRTPPEIAAVLCCSRSSRSRIGRAYRAGTWVCLRHAEGQLVPPLLRSGLSVPLPQALVTLLAPIPQTYGWGRTRWRCATLALTLHTQHGATVSAETVRRWLDALG